MVWTWMLREKIARNNSSISYITIIRQHIYYDEDEVDDDDNENDNYDNNDNDDGNNDDDDNNNNVFSIHVCYINSTKAGGTEKNPTSRRQTSWLFTSTIEDLYSELQRKKMKIAVKLKGILISTDIACFAK